MPRRRGFIGDIGISFVVILVVLLIIIPLPTALMDVLITFNIAISIIILLISINTKEPLDFSIFPTMLLITTIFRLALNISSTRLILGNGGDAGELIKTFGEFVAGGNLVVGIIIFLIIFIVQLMVITKGAGRVSEVAARFTLDAMPGKQMSIDADLNAGVIDEAEARKRRTNVSREADFFASMDGASKFVKGDSTVSIITTFINVIGGIIIGVVMGGGDIGEVALTYTIATIGDGLAGQVPSLLISTAMGIVVTKASSDESLGTDVTRQLGGNPMVLFMAAAALMILMFIPGMPVIAILAVAALFFIIGMLVRNAQKREAEPEEGAELAEEAEEVRKPENVVQLLQVDPIELEFGYGIIPLADASQGGDLLDRVVMIRRQCAVDLGMIVPVIRLRDNIQFAANEYCIKIKGNEVARAEIVLDHFLAMNPGDVTEEVDGIDTVEPAFGIPAKWVNDVQRERAEMAGYTIVDPPSVVATHLTEIVRRHAYELIGRQQVQVLIDNLRQSQPSLVDEVVPSQFSLGEIQRILSNLLREGVSIRDMATILETMSDYAGLTRDPDMLTEYVRQALRRTITARFVPGNHARVITIDPVLEQTILENIRQTEHGTYVSLEPDAVQAIFTSLRAAIERVSSLGLQPIVLAAPVVRFHFKKMVEQLAPDLVVLSYNELEQNVDIQADGVVSL